MAELVRGEAPESDEELNGAIAVPKQMTFTAKEMPGEATESDEEIYEQPSYKTPLQSNIHEKTAQVQLNYNNSFLKRKLNNNLSICRNLNALIKNQYSNASKELIAADQMLMKSQLTMQSVLMSIKSTKRNLTQLLASVSNVCTANFIPDLKPWTFKVKTQTLQVHEE